MHEDVEVGRLTGQMPIQPEGDGRAITIERDHFELQAVLKIGSAPVPERLLGNCACPMFAGERLVWAGGGAQVRYRLPWAALQVHGLGQQRSIELRLSASEYLDLIAALIPPLRKQRHRYFRVFAPNSPWRALVTVQPGRKLTAVSRRPLPNTARSCG